MRTDLRTERGGRDIADPHPVELAPHAVVRAARWPVSSLMALASPATPGAEEGEQAHADRLRTELQRLWQHTLGSLEFRKALAVSHPDLYARLRHTPCPTAWNKAARQLTATLYRQWARACWRTEPSGLWAGVATAPLRLPNGEGDHGTLGRVAVAPHLQPFSDLLRALSLTPAYRTEGRFKVHPSAWRQSPGVWLVRVRDLAGHERTRRLQLRHVDVDGADRCINALVALGPLPHGAMVRVALRLLGSQDTAQALVDQLLDSQCLIGGLSLPHLFETAWDALEQSADALRPDHQAAWRSAIDGLSALCQHLEANHGNLTADAVLQADRDAGSRLVSLAGQLGVAAPALPRACLHWDAGLPAAVRFDAVLLDRARRALESHERHHHQADPVVAIDRLYARAHDEGRAAALRRTLAAHAGWEDLADALSREQGDDGGLADRVEGRGDLAESRAQATPFGALMLRIGRDSALVQGLSHEPWLSYARFGALLGSDGPQDHPLHAWCDRALARFAQSANVRLAQLGSACAPLANLLAQPRFSACRPIDPYGTTPGAVPDAGAQLCHDGQRRWLQSPSEVRPILVLGGSALDLGARDPLLERLLMTGWRYRPPVSAAALRDGRPMGQPQRLAGDLLRRRPRWRVDGDEAMALAHAAPAERWARWQALARAWDLPDWVTVSRDGEPALPMPRDSALGVEVMFRAPGAAGVAFEIEVPEDECWLTDLEGNRYATELILVFARRQHAWNLRGDALAAVPAEPGPAEEALADCHPG